ncbi:hypothetical protein WG66_009182 [Moniliophthora roreri]|nr:hypothetical protein WG66_009182 [Moniliophthora roreri]
MVVNNDWVGSDASEQMIEAWPQLELAYLQIAAWTTDPGQVLCIVQEHASSEQIELLGYGKGFLVIREV